MTTKYTLYKIKSDRVDQWSYWCAQLSGPRHTEAAATLQDEGIVGEMFFIFFIQGVAYTLGCTILQDQTEKKSDQSVAINREHQNQKLECLEFVSRGDAACSLLALG